MSKTLDELMALFLDLVGADRELVRHHANDESKQAYNEASELLVNRLAAIVEDAERYQHIKNQAGIASVQTQLPLYRVYYWHGLEQIGLRGHFPDMDSAVDSDIQFLSNKEPQ